MAADFCRVAVSDSSGIPISTGATASKPSSSGSGMSNKGAGDTQSVEMTKSSLGARERDDFDLHTQVVKDILLSQCSTPGSIVLGPVRQNKVPSASERNSV
mmetsp:Transcript_4467/g.13353  ORF Transcript_4467/g.13353 Transcript_4467/m.13353 type:complete len:101 (+) Transcript_4467:811-1113(+)